MTLILSFSERKHVNHSDLTDHDVSIKGFCVYFQSFPFLFSAERLTTGI